SRTFRSFPTRRSSDLFGMYLVGMFTRLALAFWSGPGGAGSPRSPLYGIWDVAQMSVDGQVRSPLLNDYDRRWRRVIFDDPRLVRSEEHTSESSHEWIS